MKKILLVLPILLFAACSGPSEVEDLQDAHREAHAQLENVKD